MSYLTIVSAGERNWQALVPELHCIVTASSRDELLRLSRESLAVALEDRTGHQPVVHQLADVAPEVRRELTGTEEVLFLDPAPMNPVSLAIQAALDRAGISQAELARRMGTSRSAVHRLLNPFYWGHSLELLRRVAEALDARVHVTFEAQAS
ncbi:helix-turn-helix domain-containing protein [Deinococcus multiflagellatus]|uniref:Helix-turn-helix domain-containing protein n=1 Tax=Deinococcus multiflagellatus TaxID=1656887 RepID=A0ABW1ZH41_9DEIO|nr:helix-turn-helix transcriptional regulator [Deinococcus multiflagellatus]MBZ9712119.1 helix-turn-helix transcriptional regulator [Deinococcus multiflagellatus]